MHPVHRLLLAPLLLAAVSASAADPAPPAWINDAYLRTPVPSLTPETAADDALRDAFYAEQAGKAAGLSWQRAAEGRETDGDLLLLPGLIASRSARAVWLWSWGSGMDAGEPVEFFVIHSRSGHGYETVLCTSAQPGDVHRALEFIGLKPGWPANPARQRLWPKGDRVAFTVRALLDGADAPSERPIESFITVSATGQTLPATNHVFVGSVIEPDPENPAKKVYAADRYSPNAISANFNLEPTVFDLPRQARKEAVYGTMIRAKTPDLRRGQPAFLRITPHPDFPAGSLRDASLAATNRAGTVHFALQVDGQPDVLASTNLVDVVKGLVTARAACRELHLRLDLAPELNTRQIFTLASALSLLDNEAGIRVDPPAGRQLFYRAYTPRPEFRDRRERPFQPWELYLTPSATGDGWSARLVVLEEKWPEGKTEPDLVETPVPVTDPAALRELVAGRDFVPSVLFIFAPAELPHGEAQRWVEPVRSTFPVVYVFPEPALK